MNLLGFLRRERLKPDNTPAKNEHDDSPKEKFRLILEFANDIVKASQKTQSSNAIHPLVDLVRLIGRDIQTDYLMRMLYRKKDDDSRDLSPDNIFFDEDRTFVSLVPEPKIFDDIKIRLNNTKTIRLDRDLVLPWPWRRSRLINCISSIGPSRMNGYWRQDENHIVELWLPMGIAWVRNGNHSIATGIIQGDGVIVPAYTYDISNVYQYIDCDGDFYIRKQDKAIIEPVRNAEMAAIFEIGRIMHNYSISF